MPTFPCPDCGRDCSTEALACPNCARPFQKVVTEKPSPVVDFLFYSSLAALAITALVIVVWYFGWFDSWRQSRDTSNHAAHNSFPSEQQIRQEQELFIAAYQNDYATLYKLTLQGVNVNSTRLNSNSCSTPLTAAVLGGSSGLQEVNLLRRESRLDVVRALLEAGADVNAADKGGATALMYARADGDALLVDILLKAGANHNVRDDFANTDAPSRRAAIEVHKLICLDALKKILKENLKKSIEQQVEQEK